MNAKYQITVGTYNPFKVELVHPVTFIQRNEWGGGGTTFTSASGDDPLKLYPADSVEKYAKHFVWELQWERSFTITFPFDIQVNRFYSTKYASRQPISSMYVQAWINERLKAEKQIHNLYVKLPITHGPGTTIVKLESAQRRSF